LIFRAEKELNMAHETTYILLLRGINVGGRNKLPTAPFCEQLKSEGFSNVRSYLASGTCFWIQRNRWMSYKRRSAR
jgi:uncharacterized protein (DUF1697 family)